ncbi:MAG: alpha/beta hydrolase [Chloroflexi bacterium]|nr:alpha/beta hydrolase [Chloroflexota bacterium]
MTTETTKAIDRFVRVGDLNLHYLESGEAGAPPVIMVHGLSGNAHNFDNLAPYLATRYHVISVDVRGRGDSDWAADANYSNEAYIADLEGLRQALGFERMSLVGTSLGGRISMSYAGTYPDRVERAVLNDIGPDIDPRGGARIAESTRDAVTGFATMDEVIAWHREQRVGFSSLSDADQRAVAGHAVKDLPSGGYTWKMDPAVRTDPRRPDPEVSWKLALNIPRPVLLVRGGDSDLLSPETAWRMVSEMQDCRMVEVPGVGHAPTLTEPEALGPIMEFFTLG